MQLLDETNAEACLRERGWLTPGDRVEIVALAGGVSNEVLRVSVVGRPAADFVLKQARPRLRVRDEWLCTVERIWREIDALTACGELLRGRRAAGGELSLDAPRLLFEDRENYAFAMCAAPRTHRTWRDELLAGRASPEIARACGAALARLHAASRREPGLLARLADRQIFDELRLDPYYRTLARRHPAFAEPLERLVASVWERPECLVHADFSPKNILVHEGALTLVDFETAHVGDPAFDLGFFLSHLLLKAALFAPRHEPLLSLADAFWRAYHATLEAEAAPSDAALPDRAARNLAGCLWARLDGKSPVGYLEDPARRDAVRGLAQAWLVEPPEDWPSLLKAAAARFAQIAENTDADR